jgi:hypothetical protein
MDVFTCLYITTDVNISHEILKQKIHNNSWKQFIICTPFIYFRIRRFKGEKIKFLHGKSTLLIND